MPIANGTINMDLKNIIHQTTCVWCMRGYTSHEQFFLQIFQEYFGIVRFSFYGWKYFRGVSSRYAWIIKCIKGWIEIAVCEFRMNLII